MMSEEKFKSLICGKNVAIVGPAKYMLDSSLGAEIDEHDVVVRINRSIETTKQYPKDVGTKCDILYSCLIETAQNAGNINPDELKNDYGVRCLVAPPQSEYSGISTQTKLHYMANQNTVKKIKTLMPLRIVSHVFHTELAKKVESRPNTGYLAIYDLLSFQPKSLSIYGFSFYLDGFIPGCKSGIEKEKNVSEDEFANMAFNSKRHNQKNMWQHAKDTLPTDSTVLLDDVLKIILSLDKLDKELFKKATG
jgi:hypothetical protein